MGNNCKSVQGVSQPGHPDQLTSANKQKQFLFNDAMKFSNIRAFTRDMQELQNCQKTSTLIPLRKFEMKIEILSCFGEVSLTQIYQNATDKPLEILFQWPIQEDCAIVELDVTIGDKVAVGKVHEKAKAKQKHEDSVAKGNFSVYSAISEDKELLEFHLGNLLPNEEAKVFVKYVKMAHVEQGNFHFQLPSSEFPKGQRQRVQQESGGAEAIGDYEVDLSLRIQTSEPLSYLHCPQGFELVAHEANVATLSFKKLSAQVLARNFDFYFSTKDVEKPQIFLQNSTNFKDEVGCLISAFPSLFKKESVSDPQDLIFKATETPTKLEIEGEIPETLEKSEGGQFIFLIDRSGSMSGSTMVLARNALILFLKSLPPKSKFQVISFGSGFDWLDKRQDMKNTETEVVHQAVEQINKFDANYGGTEILAPLDSIFKNIKEHSFVFVLTDGEVDDTDQVINIVKKNNKIFTTHSFGVGDSVDTKLVNQIAEKGNGQAVYCRHGENMNAKVIESLTNALVSRITNVQAIVNEAKPVFQTQSLPMSLNNLQGYKKFFVLKKVDLEKFKLHFGYKLEQSGEIVKYEFSKNDFLELPEGDSLLKMCAFASMQEESKDKVPMSVKYQVLCNETAMVAEIKQKVQGEESELVKIPVIKTKNQEYYDESEERSKDAQIMKKGGIGGGFFSKQKAKNKMATRSMAAAVPIQTRAMNQIAADAEELEGADVNEEHSGASEGCSDEDIINCNEALSMPKEACYDLQSEQQKCAPEKEMADSDDVLQRKMVVKKAQAGLSNRDEVSVEVEEESKVEAKQQVPKIDFMDIVKLQDPEGFWASIQQLQSFLSAGFTCEAPENIQSTLVALLILNERYPEKKSEWKLVQKKALYWLKNQGVPDWQAEVAKLKLVLA